MTTLPSLSPAVVGLALVAALATGCRQPDPTPTKTEATELAPSGDQPEPEHHLIRYACQGFDAAVAAGAPKDRLLSASAKRAVELGGDRVEQATQGWALQPPRKLLDLIDRYERETAADPAGCAGLRGHLERMAAIAEAR